jgi:hypothetical protein
MGLVATGGGDDSAYLWRIGQVEEAPIQLKGQALPQGTVQGSVSLAASPWCRLSERDACFCTFLHSETL